MASRMNLKVTLSNAEGAENELSLSATVADLARYDIIRAKLGWPGRAEADFLFMVVVAYACLVRTGQISANVVSPEKFIDTVVSVELDDDEPAEGADKS